MVQNYTGIVHKVYDLREGLSQKTQQHWYSVKVWLREKDSKYDGGLICEVWKSNLIEWLQANIGAEVTVSYDSNVKESNNGNPYQFNKCFSITFNGQNVTEQNLTNKQTEGAGTYKAKDVPPTESEDDLPF